MTIGERVKKARKDRALTQKQLSELSGVAEITIRKYENNQRQPKIEKLQKIAGALGVSPFWLMGEDNAWSDVLQNLDDVASIIDIAENESGRPFLDSSPQLQEIAINSYVVISALNTALKRCPVAASKNVTEITDFLKDLFGICKKHGIPISDLAKISAHFAAAEMNAAEDVADK